jgi:DNA-binding transcriptional ArsR family regulator
MGHIDNIKDVLGTEFVYSKGFYNNVFKKTEKIVSAVFFILQRQDSQSIVKDDSHIVSEIQKTSLSLLSLLSETLITDEARGHAHLHRVSQHLILLNSLISVAVSGGVVAHSYGSIITAEITSVLDSVREFDGVGKTTEKVRLQPVEKRERVVTPSTSVSVPSAQAAGTPDRKERILEIVKDKGQVSIKDISDTIKDVSEKSIQRDLNSLIEKGQVIRQGERRWSTYSIA